MSLIKKIKRSLRGRIYNWRTYHKLLKFVRGNTSYTIQKVVIHGLYRSVDITLKCEGQ